MKTKVLTLLLGLWAIIFGAQAQDGAVVVGESSKVCGISLECDSGPGYYFSRFDDSVTATPDIGYKFLGWYTMSADDTSRDGSDAAPSKCSKLLTNSKTISSSTYSQAAKSNYWAPRRIICPKQEKITYTITLGENQIGTYQIETSQQTINFSPPAKGGHTLLSIFVTGASGGSPSATTGGMLTIPANTYGNLTLTANWEANSYKITINPNGGTGGSSSATYTTSTSDQNVQITLPTREGYDIKSWSVSGIEGGTTPTVSGTAITIKAGTYGAFTITPTWAGCQYTINYDLQGGTSGATAPTSAQVDTSFSVSAPTKTDCTFIGWTVLNANYTSAKYGTGSDAVTPITSDSQLIYNGAEGSVYFLNLALEKGATVTLQANWKAVEKTYKVTVEVDDPARGSVALSPQAQDNTYPEGTSVTLTATPKPGYAFSEWNDKETTNPREIVVAEGLWFKANFTACVYTVTFDAKGGSFEDESKKTCSVKYNETIATFPTVSRSGFRFKNWYVSTQGYEPKPFYANTPYTYTSDITVSANWEEVKTYKVEVQLSPADGGRIEGVLFHEENIPTELKAVPNPGYSFKEWQTTNGVSLTTDPTTSVCDNVDIALTAVFTGNVYTVTYNGGRTFGDEMSKSVTFGEEYGKPSYEPQMAGFSMEGWYTETKGKGSRIDPTNVVTTAKDHDLFANWIEIPTYKIIFDGMGETSGTMEDQIVPCGDEVELSANKFEKAGHEFLGWATTREKADRCEPESVEYNDCASVKDLAEQGVTVTLYAVWKILPAYALDCLDLTVTAPEEWKAFKTNDAVNGSCLRMTNNHEQPSFSIVVPRPGFLSFNWKGGYSGGSMYTELDVLTQAGPLPGLGATPDMGWTNVVVDVLSAGDITFSCTPAHFYEFCMLDNVSFTTAGVLRVTKGDGIKTVYYKRSATDAEHVMTTNSVLVALDEQWTVRAEVEEGYESVEPQSGTMTADGVSVVLSATKKAYKVTFHDEWLRTNEVQSVAHGEKATPPDWLREGYNLSWDADFSCVTSNMLVNAIWAKEMGPYSDALDCTNLEFAVSGSVVVVSNDEDCVGKSYLKMTAKDGVVSTTVSSPGTLTFNWKGGAATQKSTILLVKLDGITLESCTAKEGMPWEEVTVEITNAGILSFSIDEGSSSFYAFCALDYVRWAPKGGREPGSEDAATVSAAKVADGRFILEFTGKADFDYLLMTNGDLSVKSWGELERLPGTGDVQTFEPAIDSVQPQLFYRIDTIQRQ